MKKIQHNSISKRQNIANVRYILSKIFQKLNLNTFSGSLTTITDIQFSTDMRQAHIYVSTIDASCKDALLTHLRERKKEISTHLHKEIRHQFRYMPEIQFHIDDTPERAQQINQLLDKLRKQ